MLVFREGTAEMISSDLTNKLISSRQGQVQPSSNNISSPGPAEGGCGVIGLASNQQLAAKHLLRSLQQMRNRGNGKGGGIAAVGLVPEEFGVTRETLENAYLYTVAYLDDSIRDELESRFIDSFFEVDHLRIEGHLKDYTTIAGLEVRPPEVVEYFVRPKSGLIDDFSQEHAISALPRRMVEDEFVYQNTFRINTAYYQSTGEKQAFVLSHSKNMLVLKMVGYGDDVIRYYQIEDLHAHVWIGHHRYPTKGRVWHPGGAHPFIGMNEALVHNGDFANHAAISEYLAQRNIYPLFLTDTEVAVQVFDLLHRTYRYPLEYVIEAMAPTTERDFTLLPSEKKAIYEMLQTTHMAASPDGPWFFLIAQSDTEAADGPEYRLTGITDTSMLRPQVFAWQESILPDQTKASIGLAASEKQAIDATLESLAGDGHPFWTYADRYWNARGGSHTDGGAFVFTVATSQDGKTALSVKDKFGSQVPVPTSAPAYLGDHAAKTLPVPSIPKMVADELFNWFKEQLNSWTYEDVLAFLDGLTGAGAKEGSWKDHITLLTLLIDRRYPTGDLRRSSLLTLFDQSLARVVDAIRKSPTPEYVYHTVNGKLPAPQNELQTVVVDCRGFDPEGESSVAREIHRLAKNGFTHFLITHARGHRFIGSGLGPDTGGIHIDVYGSSGDYLGSGLDGIELQVHNSGQDQLAQIMKAGKLVVYGDVGQTFMYGAKGGEAYILGNTAGRPLINAVGKPRVVINGTSLDYLAESFMAGNPLDGGGFVILNGIAFTEQNQIYDLETPYPGGNLFSLASGGAIYIRDPRRMVSDEQLNGGELVDMTLEDWDLIRPYLEENNRLFGIPLASLLSFEGKQLPPERIYRKIQPVAMRALQAEEAWVVEKVK
jgi:glutamate synthase domain-containing protein 1/glutamate synthase domain-containing protein 3